MIAIDRYWVVENENSNVFPLKTTLKDEQSLNKLRLNLEKKHHCITEKPITHEKIVSKLIYFYKTEL